MSSDLNLAVVSISSDFDESDDMAEARSLRPIELRIAPYRTHKDAPNDFKTSVAISLEAAETMARALTEQVRIWREALAIEGRSHECTSTRLSATAERLSVWVKLDGKHTDFVDSEE